MELVDAGGRSTKAIARSVAEDFLICFNVKETDETAYFEPSTLKWFYQLLRDTTARMKVTTTQVREICDVILFSNQTSEKFNDYVSCSKLLKVSIVLTESDLVMLKMKGFECELHSMSKQPEDADK